MADPQIPEEVRNVRFNSRRHPKLIIDKNKKIATWSIPPGRNENDKQWAFSYSRIPRGKVVWVKVLEENSKIVNGGYAADDRRGYFTFISIPPATLSSEQLDGSEPIEGFDDPSEEISVDFAKGHAYALWVDKTKPKMYCYCQERKSFVTKDLPQYANGPKLFLMLRATGKTKLKFAAMTYTYEPDLGQKGNFDNMN